MGRISSPEFIGRVEESRVLDAALQRALDGGAPTVLAGGEAGVGKSRLIAEFAARAPARVLIGRCAPLGSSPLPFAPLVDALREHELTTGGGDWYETGQSLQFERFFVRLEALAPLVLVLEDLHWADRSTLDLLSLRVHTARVARCLIVATYRSDELAPALRTLLTDLDRRQAERVELQRFGRTDLVAQLAGILGHAPDYELVEDVLGRSGGNPFLAEEVLAGPAGARDIVLARVEALSENAQRALRVLSAARQAPGEAVLAAVTGLDDRALEDALREALERQVLVGGYEFRHALTREAIYDGLLPGERRRIHLALAGGPDRAHHLYCAGDPRALEAAVQAGLEVDAVYAHGEALTQYERALELWGEEEIVAGLDHAGLLARAAEAASGLGEPKRAARMVERALAEVLDPVRAGLLHERLGRFRWIAGETEQALVAYEEAVRLIPDASPERARAIVAFAHARWVNDDDAAAERLSREALAGGAAVEEARALAVLGAATRDVELVREGRARLEEAGAAPDFVFATYSYEASVLGDRGDHAAAVAALRPGIELMRRYGMQRSHQTWLEGMLALSLLRLGAWDEADALLEAAILRGPSGITRRLIQLLRAELALARGDTAAAAAAAADARAAAGGDQPYAAKLFEIELRLAPDPDKLARALELDDPPGLAWLCWHVGERERLRAILPSTPEIAALQMHGVAAADAWQALGQPYMRALCLVEAATAERGTRRAAWLQEAREIARALGAKPLLERIGGKPALPYGLTARGFEVLRLVEQGLTNVQIADALFISRKTASAHVSSILAKLGVARRSQAAAIAAVLDG